MGRVADAFRDAVLLRARTMSDGRAMVRVGPHFYIMDTSELRQQRCWRFAFIPTMFGIAFVQGKAFFELFGSPGDSISGIDVLINFVLLLLIMAQFWWTRRLEERKQPDDDRDRFFETWNQID